MNKNMKKTCVARFLSGTKEECYQNALLFKKALENKGVYFDISSVSRDDLKHIGFDISKVDDATMDQLAGKLGNDYCEQLFWQSLEIIAGQGLNIRKN